MMRFLKDHHKKGNPLGTRNEHRLFVSLIMSVFIWLVSGLTHLQGRVVLVAAAGVGRVPLQAGQELAVVHLAGGGATVGGS